MVAGPLDSMGSALSGHRASLWLMIANEAPWHLRTHSTDRHRVRGIPLCVPIHKCSAYTLIELISHSIHRQGMWGTKRDSKHLSLF